MSGGACLVAAVWLVNSGSATGQGLYSDEALERGIDFTVTQGMFGGNGQFGCGVAMVDLDGDGDDDVVCTGAADDRLGFFRNDGTGVFADVSSKSGLGLIARASGVAAGDFDADGDLDLAVTRWIKSTILLRNDGAMHFTDATASTGIAGVGAGAGCAWADFDGDGWIDLAVANRTNTLSNMTRNKLWRNNGDGTFSEVAAALGVDNGGFPAFMVSWCDLDRDGDQDLYVANDKGTSSPFWNRLYRNNGDGTFFEDFAARADVHADAMGSSYGDLNQDGWPDIFVPNISIGNHLLQSANQGTNFIGVASEAGVEAFTSCWGAVFFDPNNDGRTDLFCAAHIGDNFLWVQGAAWPLLDLTGAFGLSDTGASYCVAASDIDRDGDEDLLVQNHNARVRLWVNHIAPDPSRRWIQLRAAGRGANTHGIGTRVEVRAGGRVHWREVAAGTAYKSQSSYALHVGLGQVAHADEIEVAFPPAGRLRSATRILRDVPTNLIWPLHPPEALGDADRDGVRSDGDRAVVALHLGSACTPALAVLDLDGDSAVTRGDLEAFDRVQCDLDGDSRINATDLSELLARFGSTRGDFDSNGATDERDLERLLACWTE